MARGEFVCQFWRLNTQENKNKISVHGIIGKDISAIMAIDWLCFLSNFINKELKSILRNIPHSSAKFTLLETALCY